MSVAGLGDKDGGSSPPLFFKIGSGKTMRVDGGYVDLEIELVEDNSIMGVVLTELPEDFALGHGESIEVYAEEILYKVEETEH